MNTRHSKEQQQLRVLDYLYGELTPSERARFEQDLDTDPQLRALLDQEQQLDALVPPGTQPALDEERLQGNRWLLGQNLQRAARPRFSLLNWLGEMWAAPGRPWRVSLQAAAMAMTFALGFMLASGSGTPLPGPDTGVSQRLASTPLDLIREGDFEIYQLRVNDYDAASGDIDLSFSLASDTRLTGNVADRQISQLMAVALQDDIGSAARLDTINVLQAVGSGDRVNEALIHVLVNDDNPGVRYQAVQALAGLAEQERVREALRLALRQDANQGVRVEAFNALMNYRDEETLDLFRQQMTSDDNEYIRSQARSIVEASAPDNGLVL